MPGVRAALCSCRCTAHLTRAHNDANVLALGARITGPALAIEAVRAFCTTTFDGGRHSQRLAAIARIEEAYCAHPTERRGTRGSR